MKPIKILSACILALAMLVTQLGTVFAAPARQDGFITGNVTALTCEEDGTFLVTVQPAEGEPQTVRIDQATAEALGLITVTEGVADCSPEALAAVVGMEVSIDPATVIPDPEEEEEFQHPVGAALANFFSDITDYDTIMDAHEDGFGFGVIAQALFMTNKLEGDGSTFLAILQAKKTGDFSAFVFEDGSSPKNWGQFRKAVLKGEKVNLGSVMSEKNKDKDKGKDKDGGNGNGNGAGNDNDNGKGNGNGKGKGNGNGKKKP
jgi:hypothetical protein